ncbi:unnamed protein product [Rangifer tarandus platyrhynchus]|uniref:Uncharacterized protein n=1 Tax=Rangifer tarandus platyrhynchus TaxID=3082113 RepID=A0AC59Z133_RANTA
MHGKQMSSLLSLGIVYDFPSLNAGRISAELPPPEARKQRRSCSQSCAEKGPPEAGQGGRVGRRHAGGAGPGPPTRLPQGGPVRSPAESRRPPSGKPLTRDVGATGQGPAD